MRYTYCWGQRPLDGFTIKRGLGQGGFGEVYFAVSDGGKEVALKLIRGETDVRGSMTCLNLKHPNLLHLYDIRRDDRGDCWLVMEFIQGQTLDAILKRNPTGLAVEQAREWFTQLARAVEYLHDHAIIHRDIKPLNLFVEQGMIILGDYGLSKATTSTQLAHTSNAGSILYMAPEISSGNYSKQIDIYACGVVLYEMLTGDVPFQGESWAEIAIRHQSDDPDWTRVPPAFQPLLRKMLHKNTQSRYKNLHEILTDLEAIERNSQPASAPAPLNQVKTSSPFQDTEPRPPTITPHPPEKAISSPVVMRGSYRDLLPSLLLVPIVAIPGAILGALVTGSFGWPYFGSVLLLTIAVSWGVLILHRISRKARRPRLRMGMFGILLGIWVCWLDGWSLTGLWNLIMADNLTLDAIDSQRLTIKAYMGYMLYFGLFLFLANWRKCLEKTREEPFTFFPVLVAGFWGGLLLLLGRGFPIPGVESLIALASFAGVIQIVSPWEPPPVQPVNRKLRLEK
jgi:serine/threonine protein kinase